MSLTSMFREILLHPMHQTTAGSSEPTGENCVDHEASCGTQAPQAVAGGEPEVGAVGHAVFLEVPATSFEQSHRAAIQRPMLAKL
jgi:hypothetical protein